jgi:hypothetical protein
LQNRSKGLVKFYLQKFMCQLYQLNNLFKKRLEQLIE